MDDRFPNGLREEVEKVEDQSEKALYPYLRLHILGPFSGDCHAFLNEVKLRLQEEGYESAAICSDREDEPPENADPQEEAEFWHSVSIDFLENADVAVFFFLNDELDRQENLPERAFEKEPFSETDDEVPQDLNSSVIEELNYWLDSIDEKRERTLVIFEDEASDDIGSLITGKVSKEDVDVEDELATNDSEAAINVIEGVARNWVMSTCTDRLRSRYYEDDEDNEEDQ